MCFAPPRSRRNPHPLVRFLLVLVGSSAWLLANPPATAFGDLNARAKQAEQRGSYAEAEQLFKTALSLLANPSGHDAVILWNNVAHVHEEQRKFSDAEKDCKTSLELNARLAEPDEQERAASLNNLGAVALQEERWPE